ncbi:MAG: hypothetical protein HON53_07315 [Planctomycetaceae bacterium]|nr:hypothetical protein [Planctomycetaceae bacterium]MBT6154029.1 hypothetical protein [Planctomycetaceae bacterium]MBT6485085.1 hypothetical protein [Planctomycetaceae bacterium]MBT6494926.1 hypothetical protein [Planctomycetaceae bacterium]
MSSHLDIFRFGVDSVAASDLPAPPGVELETVAAPLSQMTNDTLSQLVADSNADWVAFADGAVNPTANDLLQLSRICDADANAACVVVPLSPAPELCNCWEQLPPQLAVLLTQPDAYALIAIRKSAHMADGGFHDVDAPLWDVVIRASFSNRPFVVVLSETLSEDGPAEYPTSLPALAPNAPGGSRDWLREHLSQVEHVGVVPEVGNADDFVALKAGLLQLHDELNASHSLSQSVEGEGKHLTGDYWHAIMHRREPDYSNAKYWFRRVGRNPIFDALVDRAGSLLAQCQSPVAPGWEERLIAADGWDPFVFVDLCEHCCQSGDDALTRVAEEIQFAEMLLLIEQTYRDACA